MERLEFLVGRWKGEYADQFGEKGLLQSSSECVKVLDGQFLRWEGETKKDGAPLNKSIQLVGFDSQSRKYVFKRFWSYGFVENGVGDFENEDTLVFDIVGVDNMPAWMEGTKFRSFIRRYSEDELGHGLLASEGGGPFKSYGESRVSRVR